uniref:SH3_10 domain-containing protein n=1 Tax=Macrostomum lignano TaxID=282301 RepID=A0A1I8GR27_9PLAT
VTLDRLSMTAVATAHQQEIDQWLHDNRNDVESAAIGCTHQALLFQQTKQAVLLEEIQALESRLDESNKSAAASLTKLKAMESQIGVNQEALTYLQQVTSLETAVMSAGQQVMEKALQMSKVTDGVVLEAKKELSAEVHGTWSWVSQLADLNRLHTRNAADYQTFHHSAYELNAMLNSRASSSSAAIAAIPANGMLGSIKRINTVLTDNLAQFNRLWQLSVDLTQRSRAVVPLHLRFSTDAIPFAGKNVFKFDDGETVLEPGEQVTVIDNSQSYTWTVRRSDGSEVEVPSTCIWLPPADPQAVQLAIGLRRKLLNTWSQVLNSLRQWIAEFFDSYLTQMLKSPVGVAKKIKDAVTEFLNSLRQSSQTFLGVDDQFTDRIVKSIDKVLEKMTICGPTASLVDRELIILKACLAKLQEHLNEWRHCSNEATEAETELQGRTALSKESSEVLVRIELLSQLQEESQSKFEELQRSMQNWRLQDVKSNFTANQRAPQPLFYDISSLSIMHSVTGRPAVSTRTLNVPDTSETDEQYNKRSEEKVTAELTVKKYNIDTSSSEFRALVQKYVEENKSDFAAIFSTWSEFKEQVRLYVEEHTSEFLNVFTKWSGFDDYVRKYVQQNEEKFIT